MGTPRRYRDNVGLQEDRDMAALAEQRALSQRATDRNERATKVWRVVGWTFAVLWAGGAFVLLLVYSFGATLWENVNHTVLLVVGAAVAVMLIVKRLLPGVRRRY